MLNEILKNPVALLLALLVHVLVLGMMGASFHWVRPPTPPMNVVQATVVSEPRTAPQPASPRPDEAQQQERERQKKETELKRAEEQRLAKIIEQRREEELQEKLALQHKRKEKEEEQKRQRAAEQQRHVEEERRKEAEKRRVAEERRKEEQDLLRHQMEAEQRGLEAERERQVSSVVSRYTELIKRRVNQNWLRPPSSRAGLSCVVQVRMVPGGEVVAARVVKSSGDAVFDRSVETAVFKSTPLPLPDDVSLFERFREIRFVFEPKD